MLLRTLWSYLIDAGPMSGVAGVLGEDLRCDGIRESLAVLFEPGERRRDQVERDVVLTRPGMNA